MDILKTLKELNTIYCDNCGSTMQVSAKSLTKKFVITKTNKIRNCCMKPKYKYVANKDDYERLCDFYVKKFKYVVGFKYQGERRWHILLTTENKSEALAKEKYVLETLHNEIEYSENKKGQIVKKIIHFSVLFRQTEIK